MEFYFGFQVGEYSLYSVAGIDDWILQIWMMFPYGLDELQTDKELIHVSHEGIVRKSESWMNISILQGSCI